MFTFIMAQVYKINCKMHVIQFILIYSQVQSEKAETASFVCG